MEQEREGGAAEARHLDVVGGEVHREHPFVRRHFNVVEDRDRVVVIDHFVVRGEHAWTLFEFSSVTKVDDRAQTEVKQSPDVALSQVAERIGAVDLAAPSVPEWRSVATQIAKVERAVKLQVS